MFMQQLEIEIQLYRTASKPGFLEVIQWGFMGYDSCHGMILGYDFHGIDFDAIWF